MKLKDITGQRFGRLVVLARAIKAPYSYVYWLCQCDCGNKKIIQGASLRRGSAISCDCIRQYRNSRDKHRHSGFDGFKSPTYLSWDGMIQRCTNPNHVGWEDYGGRGITVIKWWRDDFRNFLEDMGERPEGMQIGRKDNDKGYNKGNCKWMTAKENAVDRRPRAFIAGNRRYG